MSILYVTEYMHALSPELTEAKEIYVLRLSEQVHTLTEKQVNEIDLVKEVDPQLKIGKEFLKSYQIMQSCKQLLGEGIIEKVIINTTYLNAYFLMQYIMYGGVIREELEVIELECRATMIEGNTYKFPGYWINKVEKDCKTLFRNIKKSYGDISNPLLSIIIPYYNLGKYLKETLESISQSTYKNYEVIIVNDGSTNDESIRLLKELESSEIKIVNQPNGGLSQARNTGAEVARGTYITYLDADDCIKPDYYERAINILETSQNIDIVYSWVEFFEGKQDIWPTFDLTMPYLLLSNMSAAFYVMRKETFLKYGLNDVDMKQGMEDYDSLISMHKNGCLGVAIPEALVNYRYRLNSMSKAFKPDLIVDIYNHLIENHQDVYSQHSIEIIKLLHTNGPGYLWNNPTLTYPSVALNANEDVNDIKYILIRLLNTPVGKIGIRLIKYLKKL